MLHITAPSKSSSTGSILGSLGFISAFPSLILNECYLRFNNLFLSYSISTWFGGNRGGSIWKSPLMADKSDRSTKDFLSSATPF